MVRTAGAVIAGLVAWAVIVTLLNFGLRAALPDYHAAEATLHFTAAMKVGRLVEAAMSSILCGIIVRMTAPASRWAAWIVGLLLLMTFVPIHVAIWNKLPVWYHLTFLVTLAPLVVLGASLPLRARRSGAPLTV